MKYFLIFISIFLILVIPVSAAGIIITRQPSTAVGSLNGTVTFNCSAEGEGLSYRWQNSSNGVSWSNSSAQGANTNSVTVKVISSNLNKLYRCRITDSSGLEVFTRPVHMELEHTFPGYVTGALLAALSWIQLVLGFFSDLPFLTLFFVGLGFTLLFFTTAFIKRSGSF